MAALFSGRAGDEWVLATRRWTILAWFFLSVGIFFGARWAYYELGWGGYWAWDPVENASLMPWLTGTAFLHSTMIQEKRNLFRVWNVALVILTFALSILGTFLVRSGIVSSVHAFANDPGRGLTILILLAILLVVSFGTLIFRADRLRADVSLDSIVSRESAFLFNNVFFLTATFTVLVGTLFPLAAEALAGTKVSVGAPYYNKVFVPLMLGMLVLMGVGPLIAWRQAGISNLKRNFAAPALGACGGRGCGGGWNERDLSPDRRGRCRIRSRDDRDRCLQERWVAGKAGWSLAGGGLARIVRRNKRRYGGMVIHVGVLLMVLGMAGSGNYQTEKSLVMKPGDSFEIAGYAVAFKEIRESRGPNWMAIEGVFEARNKGALIAELKPQRRVYSRSSMPMTEAAIHSTPDARSLRRDRRRGAGAGDRRQGLREPAHPVDLGGRRGHGAGDGHRHVPAAADSLEGGRVVRPWQVVTGLAVVALLVLFAFGLRGNPRFIPSPLVGKTAPAFETGTFDGKTVRLNDLRGKVVLVNFWATWCQECRVEHPMLEKIAGDYGGRPDFAMIGILYQDKVEKARAYLGEWGGARYTHLIDLKGRIGIDYGVYGVPETFVIDRSGVIRHKQAGAVTPEFVAKVLEPVLAEKTGNRPHLYPSPRGGG